METLSTLETKTLNGAKIIIETLKNNGVDSIFGYPGGVVLSVYDELFRQNNIKHYLVRHEQSAVHAAEGYARVSGKCGVVLVTSGPGASNTVTGIANAYLDGYPLIVLTGQVSSDLIGKDAFQEVNIVEMTKTCTKAGFQVSDINNLEDTLNKAFEIALSGKKGPVVVDITKNILNKTATVSSKTLNCNTESHISTNDAEDVLDEIISARIPVIVAGGGVVHSKARRELERFAQQFNIPVVTTLMGLGSFPTDAENYMGMIGIFGQESANQTLREADLIISLGARFNDRITCCFKPEDFNKKFIQVDINKDEISRNIPAYKPVVADIKEFLIALNNLSNNKNITRKISWNYKKLKSLNKINQPISNQLQSYEIVQAISDYTKKMSIPITTEVGQHQMFTAQNYDFSYPGQLITSGGLGTMGFGLPAAIGASIANGKSPIICIAGDGSFQMNFQELATCVDYNLPVKIFIFNNGYLGMVRQLQQKNCDGRYSETKISNPDFLKIAQAYNIPAIDVTKKEDLDNAMNKAFQSNSPFIINVLVEPLETV